MSKKIALCYLTHNHHEIVKDALEHGAELYHKYGIDVYYCDDGDDTYVSDLVEEYRQKGYDNLYVSDAHGVSGADDKYFSVLGQRFVPEGYDYIWPVKDRVYFSEKVLKEVTEEAEKNFDVIMVVNEFDRWEIKWYPIKDVYNSPEEFFLHYGQLTTNWQSMIFSAHTILNIPDWSIYEEKYHMGAGCPFNQTLTTYIRLSEISDPSIRVIHVTAGNMIMTMGGSDWMSQIFNLWIDRWIAAIFSLPSIYDNYKMRVIKAETNLPCLFGSVNMLIMLYEQKILTPEIYEKYKDIWSSISDVKVQYLEYISKGNVNSLISEVSDDFMDSVEKMDYDRAYYIFHGNSWLKEVFGEAVCNMLSNAFSVYRFECISCGDCEWIKGANSLEMLLEQYIKSHS